jgi:hypothetical protein
MHGPGDFWMGAVTQMDHVGKILAKIIQLFGIKFGKQIDQSYVHLHRYFTNYPVSFDNIVESNTLGLSRIG